MKPHAGRGVGASLLRKEDDRFLRGQGRYIGDMRMPDMLEMAFVRSPLAHGRIRGITKPDGLAFVAADLEGVIGHPRRFRPARLPLLGAADPRVR